MAELKGKAFKTIANKRPKYIYRGAVVGCGRMGSTIDDEHIGMPHYPWPWAHAPAMIEAHGIALVAAAIYFVPKYLSEQGFDITPVNPNATEILGKKSYQDISSLDHPIDIVDIFRPSEDVLPFVEDAIKMKPKVIWLQEGIHNSEAEELARNNGIMVVFNRCMLAEHKRLF